MNRLSFNPVTQTWATRLLRNTVGRRGLKKDPYASENLQPRKYVPARLTPEEVDAYLRKETTDTGNDTWWTLTKYGLVALGCYGVYVVATEEHLHASDKAWPHLDVRNRPLPWGDGNTPFFEYYFPKKAYHKPKEGEEPKHH